jgi:tetratricopeptide (TPR) repeat protein
MWFSRTLELQRKLDDAAPGIAHTLKWLSYAHERSGETGKAIAALKESMELYALDPDYKWAKVLVMIRAATLMAGSGQAGEALEMYYEVAAIEESIPYLARGELFKTYTAIIELLDRMGETSKAYDFKDKLEKIQEY